MSTKLCRRSCGLGGVGYQSSFRADSAADAEAISRLTDRHSR
jgi:hypothetical protein